MEITYDTIDSEPKRTHVFESEHFRVVLSDTECNKLFKKVQKLVNDRKNWETHLYEELLKKIGYRTAKGKVLNVTELKFEECLIAMANKWKGIVQLNETPVQKTIAEATREATKKKPMGRTEVKPKKKRK